MDFCFSDMLIKKYSMFCIHFVQITRFGWIFNGCQRVEKCNIA